MQRECFKIKCHAGRNHSEIILDILNCSKTTFTFQETNNYLHFKEILDSYATHWLKGPVRYCQFKYLFPKFY